MREKQIILSVDYYESKDRLHGFTGDDEHFYFLYQSNLWDMESEISVTGLQNKLLADEDYKTAKLFNEYLAEVTRLKNLDQWLFYPIELQIEHTNRCNARCIMCGHYHADHSRCSDISPDMIERLEFLFPFCKYIGIHGYGEPFLTDHLEDFFQLYKKYGIRLYTNTNMSYMPDKYLPYIEDMFDEINVSCESVRKEDYEAIRTGLSFERFSENINRVRRACPHVRLNLCVVLLRQNLTQMEELVDFAADLGFSQISFAEMIVIPENKNQDDSPRKFPNILSFYLKKAIREAAARNIPVIYPPEALMDHEDISEELPEYNKLADLSSRTHEPEETNVPISFERKRIDNSVKTQSRYSCRGICDVLSGQAYCSADGRFAACCVDGYHYTETIDHIYTIRDYWTSDSMKILRSCFREGKLPAICTNCNFILQDRLKYLKLEDRSQYQKMLNSGG